MSYSNGPTIVTDGLVLALDAGDRNSYPGSGTTWSDLAGSNNGTLTNGPTFSSDGGGSIVFDGTNDYVTLSTSGITSFGTGDLTISVWVYFDTVTGLTNYRTVLSNYTSGTGASDYIFGLYTTGTPQFDFYLAGVRTTGNTTLESGKWYNLVGSRISGVVSLYINSILDNTPSTLSGNISDSTPPLIGKVPNASQTGYFDGLVSSVLIYKGKGLTSLEILQNYNATKGRFGL